MKEFIKKLIVMLEELRQTQVEELCGHKDFTSEMQSMRGFNVLQDAIKIVNQLAEEYNNGWIPCSEKLPELNEEVLVTQFFDDSKHYNVTNASLISMLDGSGRVRWCSYDHFITHVIAWQPFPEPYKGERV